MIRKNPLLFSKGGRKVTLDTPPMVEIDFSLLTAVDNGSPSSGGLINGERFMSNILRADNQFNPYGLTLVPHRGRQMAKVMVSATPRPTEDYPYDFRWEICKNPWQSTNRMPVGTERWYGYRIYFNNNGVDINTTHRTEISLYQDHPGGVYPTGSNPPLQQIALAYPQQLRRTSDPYFNTPLGGEIMLVQSNGSRDSFFRWSVPNKRIIPGVTESLLVIMYTRYGSGNNGIWRVWLGIDDETPTLAVHPTRPAQLGSTVYAAPNDFSGTPKFGIYHHGFKDAVTAALNINSGHSRFTLYQDTIFEITLSPSSPYWGRNWYSLVNPDNHYSLFGT